MKKGIGEKYLPLGTVVMLKGGTKRVMIIGFCSSEKNNRDTIYDYTGCLYPEGILESDKLCLFNHKQIDEIYYMGPEKDEEEIKFKEELNKIISEQKI